MATNILNLLGLGQQNLTRNSQTLCLVCQQRVQWNGRRWIHLTIYGRGMHDARPDVDLAGDASDLWFAEKLRLSEGNIG